MFIEFVGGGPADGTKEKVEKGFILAHPVIHVEGSDVCNEYRFLSMDSTRALYKFVSQKPILPGFLEHPPP